MYLRKDLIVSQEFVPLLEKYFEFNAYPSAPDRAALARKSMMTPRQIEVWYQNHRNRAKKEGKVLKRLTTDPLPLQLPLESLEQKMPFFIIPPNERKNIVHVETSDSESSDDGVEDIHVRDLRKPTDYILISFSSQAPLICLRCLISRRHLTHFLPLILLRAVTIHFPAKPDNVHFRRLFGCAVLLPPVLLK
ncbi:hypothetical protein L208DRAFT_1307719 [Tricholoma matsutake]|nr:hypothetical protein L208DRAFT_1307719 [Tricholoma matsutake 945]